MVSRNKEIFSNSPIQHGLPGGHVFLKPSFFLALLLSCLIHWIIIQLPWDIENRKSIQGGLNATLNPATKTIPTNIEIEGISIQSRVETMNYPSRRKAWRNTNAQQIALAEKDARDFAAVETTKRQTLEAFGWLIRDLYTYPLDKGDIICVGSTTFTCRPNNKQLESWLVSKWYGLKRQFPYLATVSIRRLSGVWGAVDDLDKESR